MSLIASIPILVALLGALAYALSNGKASEMGRIAFFCGLLVALLAAAHGGIKIL